MTNDKANNILISYLPKFALLLCTVMPVTEDIDWIYYTCAALIIISFFAFMAANVALFRKSHGKWYSVVIGDTRDGIDYTLISIVGIIVGLSMQLRGNVIFWGLLMAFSILQILFPNKQRNI